MTLPIPHKTCLILQNLERNLDEGEILEKGMPVNSPDSSELTRLIAANAPGNGGFPQLPIVDIFTLETNVYRLFDSKLEVYKSPTRELVRDYIVRTRSLPLVPPPPSLILRHKPYMYWCSFERYESPTASRIALQILPRWNSDCKMRATLPSTSLEGLAFVSYSGVNEYSPDVINLSKNPPAFAGYNVEVVASDHPELAGGGLQIGVVGEPSVTLLEEWFDERNEWVEVWRS